MRHLMRQQSSAISPFLTSSPAAATTTSGSLHRPVFLNSIQIFDAAAPLNSSPISLSSSVAAWNSTFSSASLSSSSLCLGEGDGADGEFGDAADSFVVSSGTAAAMEDDDDDLDDEGEGDGGLMGLITRRISLSLPNLYGRFSLMVCHVMVPACSSEYKFSYLPGW